MGDQKNGIYDARTLGMPRMILLGFQHLFAMFGATVLVPALTGLSVSSTLLFAGLGTLLFHILTRGKVPAFLGSSFAFIGGYAAIAPNGERELLPYACVGVVAAGLLYVVLSLLIKLFGQKKVMRFFPPIVTGPIIIAIGLSLSKSAIDNCDTNWAVALVAIFVVILCNVFGKGMVKIIPIILGVIGSFTLAALIGEVDFTPVIEAPWIGLPFSIRDTVFSFFEAGDGGIKFVGDKGLIVTAVITIMPIALATMVEHIGDISAISSTTGRDFMEDPGLHRTLMGDGLATILASLFGAPANTTYGENTGVLSLTKVYDPAVIRIAALFAAIVSFSPKFAALISTMPAATVGGVSIVLYGMISSVGVRNLVENQVDLSKGRNLIIAALILGLSIGINYSGSLTFIVGSITLTFSGLAVGALSGILLNALLPLEEREYKGLNKDYMSDEDTIGEKKA